MTERANRGPAAAAENRAAIIKAAGEVFAEQGLGAPLNSIAKRAGVGQGSLYRHFPTRASLAGGVGTNITKNSGVDMSKLEASMASSGKMPKTTSPTDAARQIIEAMQKGKYRATIGGDAKFMDRMARLSPRRATLLIAEQMKSLLS